MATFSTADLGGQPDAIALASDNSFLAVAIENERDDGLSDGEIPQLPAGNLVIVPLGNGLFVSANEASFN